MAVHRSECVRGRPESVHSAFAPPCYRADSPSAHAWHISHWAEKYEPIFTAYRSAKAGGLYRNVKDRKGKLIPEAYAAHNQLEYFAELSGL
jgi:hypothetical protein